MGGQNRKNPAEKSHQDNVQTFERGQKRDNNILKFLTVT